MIKFDPPRLAFAIRGSKEYLVICKKMKNKSLCKCVCIFPVLCVSREVQFNARKPIVTVELG